jgi:dTDP-4-amino-4,6-dideoxygalactose transaminase
MTPTMHSGSSPRRVPFVDLACQHAALHDEVVAAMERVLREADFILGREVACFEDEFARYCGCEYGVGVDSGTSALELALRAYGIGAGDEVIVPANTFIATAFAVSSTGATPVLVDIDAATQTIDVTRLDDAVTLRTQAIIPVHLYGQPAHMDPILEIAGRRRLVVIEDACQAHGARYRGRPVGSLGHAAAFSFYPSKNLGAYGDGGMIVTNDGDVAKDLQLLRNYGQLQKYYHLVQGYNRRLDTLQAAVLRIKLRHLDVWNNARRFRAAFYSRVLGHPILAPVQADYSEPVWHLYVIRTSARDNLQKYLDKRGISTGIHYPIPIHLQPAYSSLGHLRGAFPITERAAETILSLPMYPELPLSAIAEVADAISEFVVTASGQAGVA